ncbi:MAG: DUF2283 domain-containing protein [Clostridia bacterium]|nr:DUF2283 domain-containing protein [Clostridia bacterium]
MPDPLLNYDEEHDVLYISLGEPVPSYSEEDGAKGVLVRYSFATGEVSGATILDYSKRNKKELLRQLPFSVVLPE